MPDTTIKMPDVSLQEMMRFTLEVTDSRRSVVLVSFSKGSFFRFNFPTTLIAIVECNFHRIALRVTNASKLPIKATFPGLSTRTKLFSIFARCNR